jgi:tRNA A37 threonylcarbamoyladenosine synthetase subunit TsaC/SUA5/YrdC
MNSSLVYLVQTDTTVGFSSSDDEKLALVKQRPISKKTLHTVDSFSTLKKHTRVPKLFRKIVRKSSKTTFIYPNKKSFRVIKKEENYYDFIHKFNILYSTSANLTGRLFDKNFSFLNSDVIVEDKNNFYEGLSSEIIKINRSTKKRLR